MSVLRYVVAGAAAICWLIGISIYVATWIGRLPVPRGRKQSLFWFVVAAVLTVLLSLSYLLPVAVS